MSEHGTVENLQSLVNSLVEEKIIFYPIKTHLESANFGRARCSSIEIPFEFEVKEYDKEKQGYVGEVVGKVLAEEFDPFTKLNSEHAVEFFRKHILKK